MSLFVQLLTEKHDVVQRQSGFCLVLFAFVQLKLMAFWNSDAVIFFFAGSFFPHGIAGTPCLPNCLMT